MKQEVRKKGRQNTAAAPHTHTLGYSYPITNTLIATELQLPVRQLLPLTTRAACVTPG